MVDQRKISENMDIPKLSVIIPVYKAELYLNRCINSVLDQTFQDFEILLINDGSPDHSGDICDEYSRKDNRVRVFHKENGGVSSARNVGLKEAKGEWIGFVDSDDWIEKDFFANIIDALLKYNLVDVVLFGYTKEIAPDVFVSKRSNCQSKVFNVDDESLVGLFESQVWNYFFKKDIIKNNGFLFDESISYAEDVLFIVDYLSCAKNICYLNIASYIYNDFNISSTTYISVKKNLDHLRVAVNIYKNINSNRALLSKIISSLYVRFIIFLSRDIELTFFQKLKTLSSVLKCYYIDINDLTDIGFLYRIKLKFPYIYLFYMSYIRKLFV